MIAYEEGLFMREKNLELGSETCAEKGEITVTTRFEYSKVVVFWSWPIPGSCCTAPRPPAQRSVVRERAIHPAFGPTSKSNPLFGFSAQ